MSKRTLSWAFYDWANSAFATTVIAGFFPIFFREFWSVGVDSSITTLRLGIATSLASVVIIIIGPILGAISDQLGNKKKFLVLFAYIGILSTACLFAVSQGSWQFALVCFALGSIGFSGGNVFYDALLVQIAPTKERIHFTSCLGYALGYLGGGLLFLLNVVMVLKPHLFGFEDSAQAVRVSFISVAIWWAVFSIPIMLFVQEAVPAERPRSNLLLAGLKKNLHTLRQIRGESTILLFLVAYWFYIDGVGTIFRMAVDYGLSIGLSSNDLIGALLVVQFVGFPAAIVFGWLGQKYGPRLGIYISIGTYVLATIWGYFMSSGIEFYMLAVMVALVQGGIQALSRSFFAQIIPQDKVGEYFGIFNMIGKAAAIVGPVLVGWTAVMFGHRNSILSIIILFAVGALVLSFVKSPPASEQPDPTAT